MKIKSRKNWKNFFSLFFKLQLFKYFFPLCGDPITIYGDSDCDDDVAMSAKEARAEGANVENSPDEELGQIGGWVDQLECEQDMVYK